MRRQYLHFSVFFGSDADGPYCGVDSCPGLPEGFDVFNANYDDVIMKRVSLAWIRYSSKVVIEMNRAWNAGRREALFKDEFGGDGLSVSSSTTCW